MIHIFNKTTLVFFYIFKQQTKVKKNTSNISMNVIRYFFDAILFTNVLYLGCMIFGGN